MAQTWNPLKHFTKNSLGTLMLRIQIYVSNCEPGEEEIQNDWQNREHSKKKNNQNSYIVTTLHFHNFAPAYKILLF